MPLYHEEKKWLFLRTAKTGSTATIAFLEKAFPDCKELPGIKGSHAVLDRYHPQLPRFGEFVNTAEYMKFGTARNPYTRCESMFRFMKSVTFTGTSAGFEATGVSAAAVAHMTFEEFMQVLSGEYNHIELMNTGLGMPQYAMLKEADLVLKYENLEKELRHLVVNFNGEMPKTFRKVNVFFGKSDFKKADPRFHAEHTPLSTKIIQTKYAEDFENYGYSFDRPV